MRKIAVVYKSCHGSTKQYAEWIAEETGADLFNVDDCTGSDMSDYDTIVFGGCIHAGGRSPCVCCRMIPCTSNFSKTL